MMDHPVEYTKKKRWGNSKLYLNIGGDNIAYDNIKWKSIAHEKLRCFEIVFSGAFNDHLRDSFSCLKSLLICLADSWLKRCFVSFVIGNGDAEGTECQQKEEADKNLLMPMCRNTSETDDVLDGRASLPQNTSRTKNQRHTNMSKPDLYRPQIPAGAAKGHISRLMTVCEE